jgi:pimeloyl-ACP methyl ester carboxylesterase
MEKSDEYRDVNPGRLYSFPGPSGLVFENSSHMPHLEETRLFLETLTDFLDRVERQA